MGLGGIAAKRYAQMQLRLGRRRISPAAARRIASCTRPTTGRTVVAFAADATALTSTTGAAAPSFATTAPTTTTAFTTTTFNHECSFRCRSAG